MHSLSRICPGFSSPLHRWLTWRRSCTHLFVGGLSYDTNETALKDAFDEYGEIIEVKVICDRVSGKSRGYGFVHYSSELAANKALKEMDGQLLDGRNIRIHYGHVDGKQSTQLRSQTPASNGTQIT
ncbi:hypothetical protein ABFS82_04G184400 [Erythranthe guttata]|uniref:glycine-rich RNA-binding protein 4, mitochondrial-like n=1 Tax=Erythranthe guttata TaxID=4155 RepID=UPI00064DEB6E|nr:PREDICTED: glycine-rich RNA-binding protein 4, mitochondrial-like [Erythranthe guttata]|eukprot:XP_012827910.1 PREDICTED: glycine-rich RNA-binding protein 4, mitochondrial-like [Erythranthe guttata]